MNEEKPAEISPPAGSRETNAALANDILSRLESKKEDAPVFLCISAGGVETLPFDLSALEAEGIFLDVDCRGLQHARTPDRVEIARRRAAGTGRGASFGGARTTFAGRLPPKTSAGGEPGAQRAEQIQFSFHFVQNRLGNERMPVDSVERFRELRAGIQTRLRDARTSKS